MKKVLTISIGILLLLHLTSCTTALSGVTSIPTDSTSIANGQLLFTQNCSTCHNFKTDGIGPHLDGLTKTTSADWMKDFIKDPKAVIESNDDRARGLFAKLKTIMLSFSQYTDDQIDELVAFIHIKKAPDPRKEFIDQPGTEKLFVMDLRGKLYYLNGNKIEVYMDMNQVKPKFIHKPHSKEKIWGTVIRINPKGTNGINGNYGIPETNPFANSDNPNIRKEIFAYGFRNPHRITWSQAGDIFVSNVGHHNVESLYVIHSGSDRGWPIREGTFVIDPSQNMHNIYPLPADDAQYNFTYPVAQYDHDEGNALAGGFEYRGKALPQVVGKFVFSDIVKSRLFYVEMKDLKVGSQAPIKEWRISFNGSIKTLSELSGARKVDERFGRDSTGELNITTKPDGKVYRLVSSSLIKSKLIGKLTSL